MRALAVESYDALGNRDTRPVEYRMYTAAGRVVWMLDEAVLEPDAAGVPVWHGVLYDISERKTAEIDLQRSLAQQAVVARLGERALKNGDPEALMRDAVTLINELDGVERACIWEVARDGRRLNLRAGLDDTMLGSGRRISAGRESHAGTALDAGVPVIVPDWKQEDRFTMPPAVRALGASSSLAVLIDGKDRPFGVLDVHSGEAGPLRSQGRALPGSLGQRPRRRLRAPRRRPGAAPPRPPRRAHRPAQPAQLRRLGRRRARPRHRLRLAGRDPLPRPRPLQAHQRQPRPRRRRRAAARGGAAAARPPAPRRHRRPLRRRRVRDPDRPARRRRRGGRDRRAGRLRLRPAVLDAGGRPLRQRLRSGSPWRGSPSGQLDQRRAADPRRRRGDVPGQGKRPQPLPSSSTPRCGPPRRAAWRPNASCAARSSATSSSCATSRSSTCAPARSTGFEALVRWRHRDARAARPERLRLDRRGHRPDRADRPLGPGPRLPARSSNGTSCAPTPARSTSPSTSRPARSPTATSPPTSPR